MNLYKDNKVEINESGIIVSGVVIPRFSKIQVTADEIISIKKVELNFLNRFRVQGTWNLLTWWCFDLARPFKKYGFIIELAKGLGTLKYLGFTVDSAETASKSLMRYFPSKYSE